MRRALVMACVLSASVGRADALRFDTVAPALRERDRQAWTGRSPDALDRYELEVTLDADLRGFQVVERLWYENRRAEPEPTLWLRVFANEGAREPPMRVRDLRCNPVACTTVEDGKSLLVLRLSRPLEPSEVLTVDVRLSGTLSEIESSRLSTHGQLLESLSSLQGGSASDYGLLSAGEGILSLSHFYAEVAAHREGQWVGPEAAPLGDKGTDALRHVRARVHLPEAMVLAATGSERALTDTSYEVMAPAVRDFTLLLSPAFVVSERRVGEVRVRAFGLQRDRAALEHVADVGAHALRSFERRYGPYPYRELDLVQAPVVGGAGGVEFSGLVTVATSLYRPDEGVSGLAAALGGERVAPRDSVREMVVAHEVAHQYWHGLVGTDSRRIPVLDEALAQYSALLYFRDRYGAQRAAQEAERQVAMNYRGMRLLGQPDGSADRAASAFGTPLSYAGLVYGKAPFAFVALERALGQRAVDRALHLYAKRHRFGFARREDLLLSFPSGRARGTAARILGRYFDAAHGDEDLGGASKVADAGQGGLFEALQGLNGAGPGPGGLSKLLEALMGQRAGAPGAGLELETLMPLLERFLGATQ